MSWRRVLDVWVRLGNQSTRARNGPLQASPKAKDPRTSKSKIKRRLICFDDGQRTVRKGCVHQSQTVCYRELLKERLKSVTPVTSRTTVRCITTIRHAAVSVNEFVDTEGVPVAPRPPYSHDLEFLFFSLPEIEISPGDTSLWDNRKHWNSCNRPDEGCPSIRDPAQL